MATYLPQRWRQQPQGPVTINWGNPLARGLMHYTVNGRDVAKDKVFTYTGNASRSITLEGAAIGIAGGVTGGVDLGPPWSSTSDFTAAVRLYPRFGYGVRHFLSAPGEWHLLTEGGTVFTFHSYNGSQYNLIYDIGTFVGGGLITGMGVFRNGTGSSIYRNGVLRNTGGPTARIANGATQICVGNYSTTGSTSSALADCVNAAVWSRALSAAEAAAWNENPWQVLKTQKPQIYYFLPSIANSLSEPLVANKQNYAQTQSANQTLEIELQPINRPRLETNIELHYDVELGDGAKLDLEVIETPREVLVAKYLPQRRTKQPQGPVEIDWSHPSARGLSAVWLPGGVELVTRQSVTYNSRAPRYSATTQGQTYKIGFEGPNKNYPVLSNGATSGAITILCATTFRTLNSNTFGGGPTGAGIYSQDTGTLSPTLIASSMVYAGNGTVKIYMGNSGAGVAYGYVHPETIVTNKPYVIAGRANTEADIAIFINGIYGRQNPGSRAGSWSSAWTTGVPAELGHTSSGGIAEQDFALVMRWSRVLSNTELSDLTTNPWQLFKPQRAKLYSFAGDVPATKPLDTAKIVAQPTRQQPQGTAQVDWSNPLSRSLVLAVSDKTEAVKQSAVPFDSRVHRGGSQVGRGWQRETEITANPEPYWNTGVALPSQTPYTMSFVLTTVGGGYLTAHANNAWVDYSAAGYLTYYHYNSANTQIYAQAYPSLAAMQRVKVLTFGWDGSFLRIWLDGVQYASQATASLLASTQPIFLYGRPGYFGWHWKGTIAGAFAWQRALTAAEVQFHASNPWQVFRQKHPVIYSFPRENILKTQQITQNTQDKLIITPQEYAATKWWPLNSTVRFTSR